MSTMKNFKRLNIFIDQREDLIKSEDHLRATLLKIDKVAREKFEKTFSQIKLNFESLFKLFFDGGQASISLIGDPDPLEAEIEIHAQPPGKKNQSLRMLSAGEKSLTAIALLFAIYTNSSLVHIAYWMKLMHRLMMQMLKNLNAF